MPIVHEYTADTNPAGPQETRQARPADTGEVGNALSRVGNAVSQAGQILKQREAQAEISKLSADMAQAHADFSNDLDDTLQSADPNDRTISDKFMQGYDDKMQDVGNNLNTPEAQRLFTKANAQMRAHFQVASMQGQSSLAGHQAVQDVGNTISNYSSSLLNDPSSFDSTRNLSAMSIQAQVDNGTLDQVTAGKLTDKSNSELAKSAVRGWISLDPNLAKQQLAKGQWDKYVDGDAKYQLQREADAGINAKRVEGERQKKIADDAAAEQQEAAKDQWINNIFNPKGDIDTAKILKDPRLTSADKEHLVKLYETQSTQKIKTDTDTQLDLFNRIHLPDGDPRKIVDDGPLIAAAGQGKLTVPVLNDLRAELKGKKTEQGEQESMLKNNFLNAIKSQLTKTNPQLGMRDPQGDTQYQSFLSDFLPAYQKARQGGKSVQDLLNPKSQDYMGNMVTPYVRSPNDIMKSIASPQSAASGAAAPAPVSAPSAAVPLRSQTEPQRTAPKIGDVQNGYKYTGGEPHAKTSWEKVK